MALRRRLETKKMMNTKKTKAPCELKRNGRVGTESIAGLQDRPVERKFVRRHQHNTWQKGMDSESKRNT